MLNVSFLKIFCQKFHFINDLFSLIIFFEKLGDFHCASLHRTSLKPNVVRSAATSPIPEILRNTPPPIISVTAEDINRPISPASSLIKKPKDIQKQHVRFLDDQKNYDKDENNNRRLKQPSIQEADEEQQSQEDNVQAEKSKESSKNNLLNKKNEDANDNQEENLHERYLLLIDQLNEENDQHLSIKDIGIILEKMSSSIVDVDKLEKEKENDKANNWLIKATVRGDFVREIGVIYQNHYYSITEHPAYF